ncbi:MAG TPA: carbamoyl-phosphate synthase large subunit [Candidatus Avichristensenella intestinipullorum]|uniref:Multifunctional fusion protein n=1 Tax=Candidatus Avichristensenella intestinipullorum TaxID=2840693 RepID=A0A9D0YY80_9FIRM|nr:carbamoyl-phosphate synthase large subunit [Candidatus Avichristensenella intestinipullorum]
MPKNPSIRKVLVIGSGPIVIGQAAEFDYAGAQACRVLRQEGINVVLVNSNPATIMTDQHLADEIYLEPLNAQTVRRIIEKERPDGLLAGLGGQTGLTIAMQLSRDGTLREFGVRLLGSDIDAIDKAEDRRLFRDTMQAIVQPVVPSDIANDEQTALRIAEEIGYPVIVRPAFTLGGSGGGIADTPEALRTLAQSGLDASPITQILVEKCISGWKEIEFETMRDSAGNAIAVCSMENFDPVGIHTGDSIVVAPAVTLADKEYQMLRSAALSIISALGIVGGCNCQFALHPDSFEYAVIEVNPRVSRSSALASKATGYPIAKITTKLALGYTLDEIINEITGKTCACFEPAVDYVVVKFPKWPFDKFAHSSRMLGTQMKATGEVMAIGQSFEEALMKAVRGAEIGLDTLNAAPLSDRPVLERLHETNDRRLFTVFEALQQGVSVAEIARITKIDPWFLAKIAHLAAYERLLRDQPMSPALYAQGKKLGYPDAAIRRISGATDLPEHHARYKMVDTCAAEFAAQTPYFYSCAFGACESRTFPRSGKPVIVVLGSGPIRIGQGIEFDYSSVHCAWTLQKMGYDVVIINNNPETVSTDYDTADRLYFEPLCPEDVMDILAVEQPVGVVVAFGGQTAIKLTQFLDGQGIRILGTSAESIDIAEDRTRFDALLESFGIRRPRGMGARTVQEALDAAQALGYPVLLRPSYVIGGQNMTISRTPEHTRRYMEAILAGGIDNPVLVDKYMPGTELEVDAISDGESVLIPGIMEHIERAGVHSGDSISVYPPYNLSDKHLQKVCDCSEKLALALKTRGLINIQYLIYEDELYVIEVNPRASRTVPYISKVTGVPMVDLASRVMLGGKLSELGYGTGLYRTPPYCAVKVPVFSFEKLHDANAILGPEMKSTGEVLGIGKTMEEALFKGLTAAGFSVPSLHRRDRPGMLISVEENDYQEILSLARRFYELGMTLYATSGTAAAIAQLGIEVHAVRNATETDEITRLMENGRVDYLLYTGAVKDATVGDFIRLHRRAMQLGIPCLTSVDTANALARMLESRFNASNTELVDINRMRAWRQKIHFAKMHSCGNDNIFIENFDQRITCPESLCVSLCAPHYGIGGDGIVLIETSRIADAKMRAFNRDGSEGRMAGNSIRCVAKYLYDKGYIRSEHMTIETVSGVHSLQLYLRNGKVSSVSVDMGRPDWLAAHLPARTDERELVAYPMQVDDRAWRVSCLSVGNPHCVVFCDAIDGLELETLGPQFEYAELFPERINTEFVRVVNPTNLRIRVWERGNGETFACGTGACAAVVAAIRNGYCEKDTEITVRLKGGDLSVRYTQDGIFLTGSAVQVYEGEFEY